MKESIAIILARGGSKRIPRKNIKNFLDQPIISYPIRAAINSGCFDKVIVSTDDEEIAEISKQFGAEVPFYRSKENANDFATTADVLKEVINCLSEKNLKYKYICCLYAAAPFVTSEKLKLSYNILSTTEFNCIVPIVKFGYPLQRALVLKNKAVEFAWPEYQSARSQDLTSYFHDTGQFYFFKNDTFNKCGIIFMENTFGLELMETEVQDIDTITDWKIAEIKYKNMTNSL
jgi:pseudaminic acid cytidylyltransferase